MAVMARESSFRRMWRWIRRTVASSDLLCVPLVGSLLAEAAKRTSHWPAQKYSSRSRTLSFTGRPVTPQTGRARTGGPMRVGKLRPPRLVIPGKPKETLGEFLMRVRQLDDVTLPVTMGSYVMLIDGKMSKKHVRRLCRDVRLAERFRGRAEVFALRPAELCGSSLLIHYSLELDGCGLGDGRLLRRRVQWCKQHKERADCKAHCRKILSAFLVRLRTCRGTL